MTDDTPAVTDEQRAKFLNIVAADRRISTRRAFHEAGVTRTIEWQAKPGAKTQVRRVPITKTQADLILTEDPDLFDEYEVARGRGEEDIRAEVRRRAIDGVDEPVFHQGQIVGTITRYSDRLLYAMAKARLPEYQDTATVQHVGPGGGAIEIEDRSASLADVARVLEAVGALTELRGGAAVEHVPAARKVLPPSSDR